MTTNITYLDTPLVVDYGLQGIYRASTYDSPAEYPEIIITKITVEDSEIDLQNILDWQDKEKIIEMIEEKT